MKRMNKVLAAEAESKFALEPSLQMYLERYRSNRAFSPKEWIAGKVANLNSYMTKCKLAACVVSVSGGVDSAVTLALCSEAAKQKGSPIKRILGVCQPIHSSGWALARGKEVIKSTGAELVVIDQSSIFDQLQKIVDSNIKIKGRSFATGQLKSYMRTPVGYYCAQLLSQSGTPCVVMGTGNLDEDGYLAYFCKAGDGVVDIQLISDLHKSEVFKVGEYLKVPESILKATPSADLWDGQSDEEELGFPYDFVELYVGAYLSLSTKERELAVAEFSDAGRKQFFEYEKLAVGVHNANKHKLSSPMNL